MYVSYYQPINEGEDYHMQKLIYKRCYLKQFNLFYTPAYTEGAGTNDTYLKYTPVTDL